MNQAADHLTNIFISCLSSGTIASVFFWLIKDKIEMERAAVAGKFAAVHEKLGEVEESLTGDIKTVSNQICDTDKKVDTLKEAHHATDKSIAIVIQRQDFFNDEIKRIATPGGFGKVVQK